MIDVACVPALSDNYVWLLHDDASGDTVVIDPGEAEPVLAAAAERGWTIGQIWNTHWHPDHVGGNAAIKAATGCTITGPAAEADRIPTLDRTVSAGDSVTIGAFSATVMAVPAHTNGHIAYHFADPAMLFSGDVIFVMGCGRLFEGTPAQMHDALTRIAALPGETLIYGAHEYSAANARFALVAEPDNAAIRDRAAEIDRLRADGKPTLPTTVALERATNPFVRAPDVATLARHRAAKDDFRG
ncbi:hydroxyacylglutathione hydrolase [Sphingomonas prati]|uniref:Hydroxyacylglutathione hydrolase n=1 Tax=Sphingomonas prati TaxID=1843237 RepID=A0A7W9F2V9_9SPHN|nr:hydroxyacylglutathione hydrolase [Sphingomonas prati]MBB5728885.1 hydroxyacylglutathione hydrolase [Sphingomonas prati]GGE86821.1 hydroxyacylglutathione hydrolase [Sphingomonas prati]